MPQFTNGDILTTFQAARLCGVSHKSIERWMDSGLLRGFRTPGGHRRLNRSDLLDFVAKRKSDGHFARSLERFGPVKVLIVCDGHGPEGSLEKQLGSLSGYSVSVASSCFEAGILVERLRPHVLIIDLATEGMNGPAVWYQIHNDSTHSAVVVVAVTDSPEDARRASASGIFHGTMVRPFPPSALRSNIDALLENTGFVHRALADT